ncbi:MAG TPA: ABC transporter substrate-binding protein [Burkholderiales bacterium]|nr:ABC transporter substrate-binding protein [Burkholderiales bacterium]
MRLLHGVLTAACFALFACVSAHAQDGKVLRVAPHSNLVVLDPVWTTAYITRNHGYLIYDTLFGTDERGVVKPQMVERWEVSRDRKVWTFTLRDGLEFHDGKPVTSEDVIASLERWGKRDAMGGKLMSFVERREAVNEKTFRFRLKEAYGLVLESLGKPGSNVPFIMPKRVAATPADRQIEDYTGSGPFIFKRDEWRPGEKIVYLRNPKYRPRKEPPSGTVGGKVAKVDRVEWVIIKDPQTQANALLNGEIDAIEAPAHELYPSLRGSPDVHIVETNPRGFQAMLRFNHLQPPFDNPKVRRAAMAALNQEAFLRVQVGQPDMYRTCFSVYPCTSSLFTTAAMDFIARPEPLRARQLLKESGYDGSKIVVMQPTDLAVIAKLPVVATQLLRQAGFNVDMQAMDWQTLLARRAKKDSPAQGGWNIFLTVWTAADVADPVVNQSLAASCDKAWFGWPCDETLERLRDAYARAGTQAERKKIAEDIQMRAMEIGTHAPLGEYVFPVAARKNVTGFVIGHFLTFWNVEKR